MRRIWSVLVSVRMGFFVLLVGLNHRCADFGVDGEISVTISQRISTPDNSSGILDPNHKTRLRMSSELDESSALSFTLDPQKNVRADVHIEQLPLQINSTGDLGFIDQIKVTLESEVDASLPMITLVTYRHKQGEPVSTPLMIKAETGTNLYPYFAGGKVQITVEFEGSIPLGPSQTIQVDGQGVLRVQISSTMKV